MRQKLLFWYLLNESMKMYSLLFLFSLSLIFSSNADRSLCPFNKGCDCVSNSPAPQPLTFDYVECKIKDGKLPTFEPAPEGKYHINHDFAISNADVRVIAAKHFAAFEYIGYLHLNHKPASPLESVEINWDDGAFDGVQLAGIFTVGLDGLIPVPVSLKNLGLRYLYVNNGRTPISIKEDSFKNLPSLQYLSVFNTTIHEIKPNAFAGLEDTLLAISFGYTDIRGFVSLKDAIKNLNKLNTLDLSCNSITEVKSDSFPEITLPYLYLAGNPIEKIDKKSFTMLKGLRLVDLYDVQNLTSADLATFTGLLNTDSFTAIFRAEKSLKSVIVSDAGVFAKQTTFDLGYTGIQTVDPKVNDLMQKNPGMYIYFDQNKSLKCQGLEWMSKIKCPARMYIDESICADKQKKLVDYLKSVDPQSKCKESGHLQRLLQMRGNLAHERQHGVGDGRQ